MKWIDGKKARFFNSEIIKRYLSQIAESFSATYIVIYVSKQWLRIALAEYNVHIISLIAFIETLQLHDFERISRLPSINKIIISLDGQMDARKFQWREYDIT